MRLKSVPKSDLVIGAVLVPGASAPRLVTREMLKTMKQGAVLVDIAIDEKAGCFETSKATTHGDPVYTVDGIIHCVANMPGAVPRTSAMALNQAVLPYAIKLDMGWEKALASDAGFAAGLNVCKGRIPRAGVAESLHMTLAAE